jgi:hypothetical protein
MSAVMGSCTGPGYDRSKGKSNYIHFQCKLCYLKILSGIEAGEAKRSEKFEAKRSEKIGFSFSLEHAKTKRNGSYFASFRFEAKKIFKRNRRTLV